MRRNLERLHRLTRTAECTSIFTQVVVNGRFVFNRLPGAITAKKRRSNPKAAKVRMHWSPALYHQWTWGLHRVKLVGFPEDTFLDCLSSRDLDELCRRFKDGSMYFERLDDDEWARYSAMDDANAAAVAPGAYKSLGKRHPGREDINKRRTVSGKRSKGRGPATPKYVDE